jgi:hypothetical protein
MKKLLLLHLLLLPLLLPVGCASYNHKRQMVDGSTETTAFSSFLMAGKAAAIKSKTVDANGYSRAVSVGSLEGQGDAASIDALGNFASKIVEGAVKGAK